MARQRLNVKKNPTEFAINEFQPSYTPKVGLTPFEVSRSGVHPGTTIFNVHEVGSMSSNEILDLVKNLDDRALVDMPQELVDEIKAGNIEHIFQTDPSETANFNDLSKAQQDKIIAEKKGSIYFRTKDGRTARHKLPDIAIDDAGWNANRGGSIFMDQSIYGGKDDLRSLSVLNELNKQQNRGSIPDHYVFNDDVAEAVKNRTFIDDIRNKEQVIKGVVNRTEQAAGPGKEAIIDSTAKAPPASTADEVSQRVVGQAIDEDIPPMPTDEDFERYATGVDDAEEAAPEPRRTGQPKPKEPVIKVGETVELSGPERKTKAKPVDTPAARVTQAAQEPIIDATQRAPRPKPTPAAAQAAAKKAAASRATRSGIQDGARMSSAVASGIRGSNNLRVAAAGAAIGVGAYAMNKLRSMGKDDVEYARMLEMQRHYRR